MADQQIIPRTLARRTSAAPLGMISPLDRRRSGCFHALAGTGFFCDEVLSYLQDHGLSSQQLATGGYTIRTTMDPTAQQAATEAAARTVDPGSDHAADVIALLRPGSHRHPVLALADNRAQRAGGGPGGTAVNETVRPVPFGAGSVYKIFTAAAAMRHGLGVDSVLPVPTTYTSPEYLDPDGAPAVVENAGTYPSELSLTDALATSPNATFVQLEQQVGLDEVVHEAISMGLTDLARPGRPGDPASSPAAKVVAGHDLSFTLGGTPTSPLQLADVGTTLASGGILCPPTPIAVVTDALGAPVPMRERRPVPPGDAGRKSAVTGHALGRDAVIGTSRLRARGGMDPPGLRQDRHHPALGVDRVPGFHRSGRGRLDGLRRHRRSRPALPDHGTVEGCPAGDLFGGQAAGLTWYRAVGASSVTAPATPLPPVAPRYEDRHLPSSWRRGCARTHLRRGGRAGSSRVNSTSGTVANSSSSVSPGRPIIRAMTGLSSRHVLGRSVR